MPSIPTKPTARSRRYLPAAVQKRGEALLHQQCWLWGQDIRRSAGNLLLHYGFDRLRPPEGVTGSTQYTFCLDDELHVRLWGFGFYFGRETGIFMNRYYFAPRVATADDVWQPSAMNNLRRATDFSLLPSALYWIAGYEEWVLENFGVTYRHRCLSTWTKRAEDPERMPSEWRTLAGSIAALTQHNLQHNARSEGCCTFPAYRQSAQIP